jgi:HEAT repeat protein
LDLSGAVTSSPGTLLNSPISLSQAIPGIIEDAIRVNIELLEHGATRDRLLAAKRLALVRPFAYRAFRPLVRALTDRDAAVREAAAAALSSDSASAPIDRLIALLSDPDPNLRAGALRALRRFALENPDFTLAMHPQPTRESIISELRSDLPERRVASASYLADEHLIPTAVAAALLRACSGGDFVAREGLVLGIERSWNDGVEVDAALKTLGERDPDPTRRAYAKAALKAIASIN